MFKYLFGLVWLFTTLPALAFDMPQSGVGEITVFSGILNDPGGTNDYGNKITSVLTIYPKSKNDMVRLVFTQFRLETDHDYLYVYNGTEVDEQNTIRSCTGYALPDTITSSDPTGAITLKFHSDVSITHFGFTLTILNISCARYTSLQTICSSPSACLAYPLDFSIQGLSANKVSLCKWQTSPNNSDWTTLSEGDKTTLHVLHKTPLYYRALVSCPTMKSVSSVASSVFVPSSGTNCYCADSLGLNRFTNIRKVEIKGTSLSHVSEPTGNAFSVYPARGSATAQLQRGKSYELTVTLDESLFNVSAWIDFNQNSIYEASEWIKVDTISSAATSVTVSITIPTQAALGLTGLRFRAVYHNEIRNDKRRPSTPSTACLKLQYGKTDEYYVSIVEPTPCAGKPFVGNIKSDVQTLCSTRSAFLTLDSIDNVSGGLIYQWEASTDNANWAPILNAQLPYVTVTQEKTTYYRCKARCGRDSSVTKEIRINSTNEGCTYLVPYQDSTGIRTCSGIVMDHAAHASYADLANGMLTILPDKPNVKIQLEILDFEIYGEEKFAVLDGMSSSSKMLGLGLYMSATNKEGALSVFFRSDKTYTLRGFAMAISCKSDCKDVTAVSTVTDLATVCSADTFRLTLGDVVDNASYQWQQSPDQTSWRDIKDAVDQAYKGNQIEPLYYRCQISCDNSLVHTSVPVKVDHYETSCYCRENLNEVDCYGYEDGGQNIVNVNIEGTDFNNDSQCKPAEEGFNYSLFPANVGTTATLYPGESYRLNVTFEKTNFNLSLWIDYDQDGVFSPNEWERLTSHSTALTFSKLLTIPEDAIHGKTRMRLRSRQSRFQNAATDACSRFVSGETEDYIITIGPSATQVKPPVFQETIALMPNPSSEKVEVMLDDSRQTEASVTIADLMGKDVVASQPYFKGIQFDVSHLQPGFYVVNVEREGRKISKKLMVE